MPCLVPDFSGIASIFSLFILILATGLLYNAFTMFRYGWVGEQGEGEWERKFSEGKPGKGIIFEM